MGTKLHIAEFASLQITSKYRQRNTTKPQDQSGKYYNAEIMSQPKTACRLGAIRGRRSLVVAGHVRDSEIARQCKIGTLLEVIRPAPQHSYRLKDYLI
jgi:hypothetical protein